VEALERDEAEEDEQADPPHTGKPKGPRA
jgi:hypothetical protein